MVKPATLAKLQHQYGRHWYGYLQPAEVVAIAKSGDAICRKDEVTRAEARMAVGNSSPWSFSFTVKADSALDMALRERVKKHA